MNFSWVFCIGGILIWAALSMIPIVGIVIAVFGGCAFAEEKWDWKGSPAFGFGMFFAFLFQSITFVIFKVQA